MRLKKFPFKKVVSSAVIITFSTTQLLFGQEFLTQPVPVQAEKSAADSNEIKQNVVDPAIAQQTSQDFLQDTLRLTTTDAPEGTSIKSEAVSTEPSSYEYERYEFEDALDLLRPEYASAVIVKDIQSEDLKALMNLSFETGVIVLDGEVVIFTSGNINEIGVLSSVKALTDKASFVSHTHPGEYSAEGPSGQDINDAVENAEYVMTRQGVYAYNNQGVLNHGQPLSFEEYLAKLTEAVRQSEVERNQVEARKELNQFISEQDLYNRAQEQEKVTLRRGGTLSYTAGLGSSSVVTLPGNPHPYYVTGTSAGTSISGASDKITLDYSVLNAGDLAGFTLSFDDASTSTVETQNLSALTNLTFGLKGSNTSIKLEVVDINGIKDIWTLTDISSSTERYWQVPVASISNALDKTKIKQLNFIVTQSNTSTQTGSVGVRVKGINVDSPAEPGVTSNIPALTNLTTLTLSGTKEANTAILINNVEVVALNNSTTWAAIINLTKESNNSVSVKAKNTIGKTGSSNSFTVKRDTTSPLGSILINGGAESTVSSVVTLTLTGSDSSGLDQMRFSMDAGQTWTVWEAAASVKSLSLTGGNGQKEVLYQLRDNAGNIALFSDTINDQSHSSNSDVTLQDGTHLFYESGVLTREVTPAGDQVFYGPDGSVQKYKYVSGEEVRYLRNTSNTIEVTDADGTVIETINQPVPAPLDEAVSLKMTFDGGVDAFYVNGHLAEFRTASDIRITNFSMNENSEIQNALIVYPDGKLEIIRKGALLRRVGPDGTVEDFTPASFLVREIFASKVQYASFVKVSQIQVSETRLFTAGGMLVRYDEHGILREVRDENGAHFLYERTQSGDSYLLVLNQASSTAVPEKGLVEAEYTQQGSLTKMVLKNGTRIFIQNGKITSVVNENNEQMDFSYVENQELLNALQVSRNGAVFNYDAKGFLSEIQTSAGTIRRSRIDTNGDGEVTDEDEIQLLLETNGGDKLSDFELDSQGNILRGIIETRNGIKQRIENGILTGFETLDGKLYEMQNTALGRQAVLTEWKLRDGTRVLYGGQTVSGIVFPDGRKLNQIGFNAQKEVETVLEELPDGTRKYFQKGRLVKLITPAGAEIDYDFEGLAFRIILPDQSQETVSYSRDVEGLITDIHFSGEHTQHTFTPDGDLRSLLMDGVNAEIENGEISRIFTRFGEIETPDFDAQGIMSGETVFADGTRQIIENGKLVRSIRSDGTKIYYENGIISAIETQNGHYEFIYGENAAGDLQSARIRLASEAGAPEYPLIPYLLDPKGLLMAPFYKDDSFALAGDANLETGRSRFGEGALNLDGSQDYLRIPDGSSPDFQYGSENFTIEFWFEAESLGSEIQMLWSQYTGGSLNNNISFYISADHKLNAYIEKGGQPFGGGLFSTGAELEAGLWYHAALVRNGDIMTLYLNGQSQSQKTVSGEMPSGNFSISVGAAYNGMVSFFKGALDEIRISKGTARWTSNFTPSVQEYKRDAGTTRLYHFLTDRDHAPADPSLRSALLGRNAFDVLADLQLESEVSVDGQDGSIFLAQFVEDSERGRVYKFSGDYTPVWNNLYTGQSFYNQGYLSRSSVLDLWDNQPALTSDLFDINGDNIADRVWMPSSQNENYWWVQLGNGIGFESPVQWTGVERHYDPNPALTIAGESQGALRFFTGRRPVVLGDLADMNGDGLPDRVLQKSGGSSDWYVQINNGHGFDAPQVWGNVHPLSNWQADTSYASEVRDDEGYPAVQPIVSDLIDMDGDGRADRVIRPYVAPFDHWFFQHNNGNGFDDAALWTGLDLSFDSNVKIAGALSWYRDNNGMIGDISDLVDLNGDNRPDRILLKLKNPADDASGYDWYVQYNNGDGFDGAVLWDSEVRNVTVPDGKTGTALRTFDYSASGKRNIASDLIDMNGDGRVDRVTLDNYSASGVNNTWWVELNTGNGFAEAQAWTGIEGSNSSETALGQDDTHYRSFGAPSYSREPDSVRKVSQLSDLNGDHIPDHVFFKESDGKWYIQYGTGNGFLLAQVTQIEALSAPSVPVPTSRYDYLHISLKAEGNLPESEGAVTVMLGDPEDLANYQEWTVSNLTASWQDFYLPLDTEKSNAGQVQIKFIPSPTASQNTPTLFVDNLTFLILRPDASKDWLDRMLTEENVLKEVHSDRTQTLAQYLGLSQASEESIFDWNAILQAETKIDFDSEGIATGFETFYGSVSKIENGRVVETTMPDGSRIEFSEADIDHPQSMTETVTNADGGVNTFQLSYGRVRSVERPNQSQLSYSYEFDPQGNEITAVYDPETQITERYRDQVLISRQLSNGVLNTFSYNLRGELVSTEISYKGRVYHAFQYQDTVSGNRLVTAEDGTVEEYNPQSQIVAHTTPDGYHYSHTFEHAPQIVTGSREETFTLSDGTVLSFTIPTIELVENPDGDMIHRVDLDSYTSADGTQAFYENGVLKSVERAEGTRITFDRLETQTVENEDAATEEQIRVMDASVYHADGTITKFKDGRPWSVISATGREILLAEDGGELINPNESAVFHQAQAFKVWNEILMPDWQAYQVPDTVAVRYEYDTQGVLLTRQFSEGSIELYENGKIKNIFSEDGEDLVDYEYNSEGDPINIHYGAMRRHLEMSVQQLRSDVAVEHEKALARLADRDQVINQTIEGQYVTARDRLLAIRAQIQSQVEVVSAFLSKGKDAKSAVGSVMDQLASAMNQVNGALESLAQQRADALTQLSAQVHDLSIQIETQTQDSYTQISEETGKAHRSILKQEISPVIYHWYRKILGRDPSQSEYDAVINATDFEAGFNLQFLKSQLENSQEKSGRTAQVNEIKARVTSELLSYLDLPDAEKLIFAQGLGIDTEDTISISSSEADAILQWLQNQSLHFGQSAYLALESLLTGAGLHFDRVDLASRLILIDILTGTLTPLETGDLVLSVYALKQTARHYGLETYALKLDYTALKAMYDDACPDPEQTCDFRMAAHINNKHFVIITKVTNDEVTYIDPGLGPESSPEVQTLSKGEFTQTWINSGIAQSGYGVVLSSRAPPASISNLSVQPLTTVEQMQVRGAFFGFLKKVFRYLVGAYFVALNPINALLVKVVESLRIAVLAHVDQWADLFEDLFTFNFKDIFQKDIWKLIRTGIRLGTESVNAPIQATVIALGKIGIPEKITRTIVAGVKIIVGIVLTIYGGSGIGLIISGVSEIFNQYTHLSPTVSAVIGIGVAIIATVFGGGGFDSLKDSLPTLAASFASVGVMAIGDAIGLDPRISQLISIPISAVAGNVTGNSLGLEGYGNTLSNIIHDTAGGLVSVGASIGLDAIGAPSFATGLVSNFLGAFAAGLAGGAAGGGGPGSSENAGLGLLSRIGDGIKKFGRDVVNAVGNVISFGAKVIEGVGHFTAQGFKKAISAVSSLFSRETQEAIYADETGLKNATVVDNGDTWVWQSGDSRIVYDTETQNIRDSFGVGGEANITGVGIDEAGVSYYQELTSETFLSNGMTLKQTYSDGKLSGWSYGIESTPIITVKGPGDQTPWMGEDGRILRGDVEINPSAVVIKIPDDLDPQRPTLFDNLFLKFNILDGKVAEASVEMRPGTSSATAAPGDTSKYIFGNGFNNEIVPENTPDKLMPSFINDLANKDLIINLAKTLMVPMYETTGLVGNILDWAQDFIFKLTSASDLLKTVALGITPSVLPILANAFGGNDLIEEVRRKLLAFEADPKRGILDKAIAFAHSGFFAPLLGALEKTRDDGSYFDVQTVINYEGPNVNWSDHIDNPNLKRIINVWGTAPNEIIERRADQIPGCNTNGSVSCIDPSKKPVVISDFGPPSNPTDLLSEWSKANFTGSAPDGIENINIKILNARHNDFSYDATAWNDPGNQFEPERIAQEINRKTNLFVRRLYEATLKDQTQSGALNSFLENLRDEGAAVYENGIWEIDTDELPY